jgi:hypothetical protein
VKLRSETPLLVTAFLVLMGGSWLMATPPGSSFDEQAHFVKAAGVGRGELYGRAPVVTTANLRELYRRGLDDPDSLAQLDAALRTPAVRWQAKTRRQFEVPPNVIDPRFGCTTWQHDVPATCLEGPRPPVNGRAQNTYVGTYQPFVYVPAGLAIRAADTPGTALRLARAAMLALTLILLIAAVWALWEPAAGALSLTGAVVAVTPMVVFVASVLSPSGVEIAGALCFSAVLLRMGREQHLPGWLWVALACGGCSLAAARALGPAFVVVAFVTCAALVGPSRLAGRIRADGKAAAAAATAIAVAAAASLFWEFKYQPRPAPSRSSVIDALDPSISHLPSVAKQAIGVFGSLDAPMPGFAYWLWALLVVGLGVGAFALGDRRDRVSVIALFVAVAGVTIVMSVVYREVGALHGRYALPFLMLLPLWEGEVLLRHWVRHRTDLRHTVVPAVFAIAAVVQLIGWWSSARRFAVGPDGGWLFLDDAKWSPPLGWWPWTVLAVIAVTAYCAVAAASLRPRSGVTSRAAA